MDESATSEGEGRGRGGLQINEDLRFQRRSWVAERIAWCVLLALVLAALVGVFGGGPLSWARAATEDGTAVLEYERFIRRGAPHEVRLRLPLEPGEAVVLLALDEAYLDDMELIEASPAPLEVRAGGGERVFAFAVRPFGGDPEDASSADSMLVRLSLRPLRAGRFAGAARLRDGRMTFRQFAYP